MGEVEDAGRQKVRQGLNSSSELERIAGDGLGRSDELGATTKSPEVNNEGG